MTFNYRTQPQNAVSLIDQRVREMVRQQGLPYSPRSVPQLAVDIPQVTALPKTTDDGALVFLLIEGGADLYLYLRGIPGWVRVSDTVPPTAPATSFPTAPVEGDTFIYDTGTSGVRWQFVYDTSDGATYPWLFIGGPDLFAEDATSGTVTSTSFTDLSGGPSAGPSVSLPRVGDYDVTIEARVNQSNVDFGLMSYAIGGTGAAAADEMAVSYNSANERQHNVRTRRKTGLAAVALTCKYAVGAAGTATFDYRSIRATPVRVG